MNTSDSNPVDDVRRLLTELVTAIDAACAASQVPGDRARLRRMQNVAQRLAVTAKAMASADPGVPIEARMFDTRGERLSPAAQLAKFRSSRVSRMRRFYSPKADAKSIELAERGETPPEGDGGVVGIGNTRSIPAAGEPKGPRPPWA